MERPKRALFVDRNSMFRNGGRTKAEVDSAQGNAHLLISVEGLDTGEERSVRSLIGKCLPVSYLLGLSKRGMCRGIRANPCPKSETKGIVTGRVIQSVTMACMIGFASDSERHPDANTAARPKRGFIIGLTRAASINVICPIGFGYAFRVIKDTMVRLRRRG